MAVNTNYSQGSPYSAYAKSGAASKSSDAVKDFKTEASKEAEAAKKSGNYGKTIGDAKLSKEAAAYYEKLKKQYGDMDFILVSKDKMADVKANAARYASPNKTVVLIDEEKVERMATDENFRKQYEGIIKNAASGIAKLKEQLEKSGQSGNVLGFGMKVNDNGTASFFAVMKKSGADQKARIEEKAKQKKADKKAAEKKAEKKEQKERLEKARSEGEKPAKIKAKDTETIEADSIEELLQRIGDFSFNLKSDTVETEAETLIGHNIDFKG